MITELATRALLLAVGGATGAGSGMSVRTLTDVPLADLLSRCLRGGLAFACRLRACNPCCNEMPTRIAGLARSRAAFAAGRLPVLAPTTSLPTHAARAETPETSSAGYAPFCSMDEAARSLSWLPVSAMTDVGCAMMPSVFYSFLVKTVETGETMDAVLDLFRAGLLARPRRLVAPPPIRTIYPSRCHAVCAFTNVLDACFFRTDFG